MMQQTRRRRHHTSNASPVGNTVLPLNVTRGNGGNTKRASSSSKKKRRLVSVVILVIVIMSTVILIFMNSLQDNIHHPRLLRTAAAEHDVNRQQVIRISSTDHVDMTEFIPCIDDVSIEPYLSKIDPVLASGRKKSRDPAHSELSCSPPDKQHCFRGVYDGFDDLLKLAQQHGDGALMKLTYQRGDGSKELPNRIAVLIESLILNPGVPLQRDNDHNKNVLPSMLKLTTTRRKTYQTTNKTMFQELHADYFESSSYEYTAILYDDTPDNLVGGETALVNFRHNDNGQGEDDVTFGLIRSPDLPPPQQESKSGQKSEEPMVLTDGLIIEPKPGRLVLFSSGGENFHAPMAVREGNRPVYHFWFICK